MRELLRGDQHYLPTLAGERPNVRTTRSGSANRMGCRAAGDERARRFEVQSPRYPALARNPVPTAMNDYRSPGIARLLTSRCLSQDSPSNSPAAGILGWRWRRRRRSQGLGKGKQEVNTAPRSPPSSCVRLTIQAPCPATHHALPSEPRCDSAEVEDQ